MIWYSDQIFFGLSNHEIIVMIYLMETSLKCDYNFLFIYGVKHFIILNALRFDHRGKGQRTWLSLFKHSLISYMEYYSIVHSNKSLENAMRII